MTKHDHWKTTDVDGEDALCRAERIDAEFVRKFGAFNEPADRQRLVDALAQFGAGTLYDLLAAEFDRLSLDQQESFLGMDNE